MYEESALKIVTTTDPKVVVTITLTSPVMREGEDAEHGSCFVPFYSITGLLISPFLDVTLLQCVCSLHVLLIGKFSSGIVDDESCFNLFFSENCCLNE